MKLTIYFEDQCKFWIGIIESEENNELRACRHIFGKEPKEMEILEFVNHQMLPLISRTKQTVETKYKEDKRINPKRLARLVTTEIQQRGMSTYAQQVIKLELENRKKETKILSRQAQEELKEKKYEIKVQKAKHKHKGR
ncbi:YjdF family protein [Paenibacillus sp. HWE-109]|uniref:YjdF family protein n=1 Tax=Paenibacillus sp. HWE-109 TaxID=1306526 RepID=UPI001EDDB82C|nr:YjdF family protein [Paenibacillus sp. HWE-109]UKS27386.1 YjdF family protein [Paenibacillus sp. HWE-109]